MAHESAELVTIPAPDQYSTHSSFVSSTSALLSRKIPRFELCFYRTLDHLRVAVSLCATESCIMLPAVAPG